MEKKNKEKQIEIMRSGELLTPNHTSYETVLFPNFFCVFLDELFLKPH